jgi:predicted RND superfamily exporter protein
MLSALRGSHANGQQVQHYARVMLRAREQQPAQQKTSIIRQVEQIAQEEFSTSSGGTAEVTGFYVLLTSLVESMIRDQWICFAWAVAGIGLMMLIAFRSPSVAAIAIVPNAVPILMVTGLMGWLNIRLNMGAAMIAAVSMGLSIDSSIHYVSFYRRERRAGRGVQVALHNVHQSVGRAMFFSTLALIIGFTALCRSQFVPTIYFGALVSLSMLGALLGNLVMLPLLLLWTDDRGDGAADPGRNSKRPPPIRAASRGSR